LTLEKWPCSGELEACSNDSGSSVMPTEATPVSWRLGDANESLPLSSRVLSRSAVHLDPWRGRGRGSVGDGAGALAARDGFPWASAGGDGPVGEAGDETGEGRPCSTVTP